MSVKERRRLELLGLVKEGSLRLVKASELLNVSYRQMKRVWKRYKEQGDVGLVHQGRGRTSNRGRSECVRTAILERYKDRYPDFGPTLACEYLAEDGWELNPETLRQWLLKEGLWKKRRRRKKHRQWRERRGQKGDLTQMDGSRHDWFEGRAPWACLMVMIDDANNETYARFYEAESTYAAMDIFRRYVRLYGRPQSLYVDRHSIYRCEREARIDEELRGDSPETQFARAMRQLQVELILANSPQAKGRVERRNSVFQDRLVKALRLEGIDTIEVANDYLEKVFLKDLNRKFTCQARETGDLHRRLPAGLNINDVLGWQEPRRVQNNWVVRWRNRFFQIHQQHERLHLPGREIIIHEPLDQKVQLRYRGTSLRFKELQAAPPVSRPATKKAYVGHAPPSKKHPWRQPYKGMKAPVRKRRSLQPS